MARRIVPKKRGVARDDDAAPLTVVIAGGMPGNENLVTYFETLNDNGRTRRVRVLGGLPDELAGERMSAEQRREYDADTYAAIFGGSLKAKLAGNAVPTATANEEQQP